jgi:antitoxin component YwqK of YwqJK toxin-antitoxin module
MKNETEVKIEYWDDGSTKSETHFKNGKKEGLETLWWKDGRKKSCVHYKDGKKEGFETCWFENIEDGDQKSYTYYKDGKPIELTNDEIKLLQEQEYKKLTETMWDEYKEQV